MIDIKLLRDDPERVRKSQLARGEDPDVVDRVLELDESRRAALSAFEQARAEQKSVSKQVGALMGQAQKAAKAGAPDAAEQMATAQQARTRAAELAEQVKTLDARSGELAAELDRTARTIGNVVIDGVPTGGEEDFTLLETVGTPRDFAAEGFAPKDHLEIGQGLGIIDIERGAKVAGSRFYYLKGWGARLEHALMGLAQQVAVDEGFTPLVVPNLVKEHTMAGAGFLDSHADEVYRLEADELYLTGTSEVGLAGYHLDEIIDLSEGPLRYAATSTCYRREAGSHGKDTKGIFRVHQFAKTEMFVYCRPEDAEAEHANLLRIERGILDSLEIPYRVIDVAAGDLGGPAARKYDIEGWVPSQDRYRELTSTSNCTTFQARRLGIRERDPQGQGTRVVATLNGTMLTSTRPIVALLENHQQADGTVVVPPVLRPFLGGVEVLEPR
ncbi:serine--tRNA ligase [Arsenicicoccus piscis]|uniref:Serine--tRNA ligase n=1 Tax=Arsenicicoccus piscis TaxID=673954 RepID=A0ABQ6HSD7_9MICO|nr:serine--tRNA ligase [Arsenicicoccus piscis]MCH8626578.1 serine--tRNA ligase [Arsenicicoccus piscis]GMA21226.1 serine--tRNA ligase [Arsenicicoccus piscis]